MNQGNFEVDDVLEIDLFCPLSVSIATLRRIQTSSTQTDSILSLRWWQMTNRTHPARLRSKWGWLRGLL